MEEIDQVGYVSGVVVLVWYWDEAERSEGITMARSTLESTKVGQNV